MDGLCRCRRPDPRAVPLGHSQAWMLQRLTPTDQQPWAPEHQRLLLAWPVSLLGHAQLSQHERSVKHQAEPMCKASSGTAHGPDLGRVQTFCTVSRRPAGPLAPPPRRTRLRSRWRSRYGGANAGRLARKHGTRAAIDLQKSLGSAVGCPCSRWPIVQGRSEPVKAVCDRRATAPVELPGERTHEDGLDRTCPAKVMAAIGSMDASGQAG
jgi:hypothetical protein